MRVGGPVRHDRIRLVGGPEDRRLDAGREPTPPRGHPAPSIRRDPAPGPDAAIVHRERNGRVVHRTGVRARPAECDGPEPAVDRRAALPRVSRGVGQDAREFAWTEWADRPRARPRDARDLENAQVVFFFAADRGVGPVRETSAHHDRRSLRARPRRRTDGCRERGQADDAAELPPYRCAHVRLADVIRLTAQSPRRATNRGRAPDRRATETTPRFRVRIVCGCLRAASPVVASRAIYRRVGRGRATRATDRARCGHRGPERGREPDVGAAGLGATDSAQRGGARRHDARVGHGARDHRQRGRRSGATPTTARA